MFCIFYISGILHQHYIGFHALKAIFSAHNHHSQVATVEVENLSTYMHVPFLSKDVVLYVMMYIPFNPMWAPSDDDDIVGYD
jgi:hypothetical protein